MTPLSDQILAWKPLVVLVGPTAVGKSDIAINIARAFDTDVLTADSRQVYRGMNIATDKPSLAQRQGVPHRLIDLVDPDQPFNTGMYRERAISGNQPSLCRTPTSICRRRDRPLCSDADSRIVRCAAGTTPLSRSIVRRSEAAREGLFTSGIEPGGSGIGATSPSP